MGLNPQDNGYHDNRREGSAGDHDGDRLTNREEYLLGTHPCLADSDGDGVDDHDEVRLYGSNPVSKDAVPPVEHANLPLTGHISTPGLWSVTSTGSLLSRTRRGPAEFAFDLDRPGIYLIEFRGIARGGSEYVPAIPVIGRVDGIEVGRGAVGAQGDAVRWLTPWLAAGRHTVTIDNRNVRIGVALEIQSLLMFRHEGEDLNSNRIPDWLEELIAKRNRTDAPTIESAVSPLCLEGTARDPGNVMIAVRGKQTPASPGLSGRWYANIGLDEAQDTPATAIFEGGASSETMKLRWKTTNLFEADGRILVRAGDSLKVVAVPLATDGSRTTASLALDGAIVGDGAADKPHVIGFAKAGIHVLSASIRTGNESLDISVEVEVIEADFGRSLDIASGYKSTWKLPGIRRKLKVEADPPLEMVERPGEEGEVRQFDLRFPKDRSGTPRVIARLGEGGPIAAATEVNAFRIVPASESGDVRVVDVLPDGTRVVEMSFLIDGKIPADLSIWIEFYVTDAVFANGDTRYHLTAADFDANGLARIIIYKAPGTGVAYVCHWIRPDAEGAGTTGETSEPARCESPAEEPGTEPGNEPAE